MDRDGGRGILLQNCKASGSSWAEDIHVINLLSFS